MKHLPEKELDKMIEQEPYLTIKDYVLYLRELANIERATGKKNRLRFSRRDVNKDVQEILESKNLMLCKKVKILLE